ncbi:flagellar biosynthetic protein FliO [Paeniglutamicibacter sulfureus]
MLRVIVSLAAVFGLLFYLRKRVLTRFGSPRASQLSVVERQGLGPKSSVVLLDVQGRRYLLGVAESSISVLDSFEAPEPVETDALEQVNVQPTMAERSRAFAASLSTVRQGSVPANEPGADGPAVNDQGTPAVLSSTPSGALAGSILSPDTWRRAVSAVRTGRGA